MRKRRYLFGAALGALLKPYLQKLLVPKILFQFGRHRRLDTTTIQWISISIKTATERLQRNCLKRLHENPHGVSMDTDKEAAPPENWKKASNLVQDGQQFNGEGVSS
jgi:hypothetical protein